MSCNTILNDINTDLSCHHTNIVCVANVLNGF